MHCSWSISGEIPPLWWTSSSRRRRRWVLGAASGGGCWWVWGLCSRAGYSDSLGWSNTLGPRSLSVRLKRRTVRSLMKQSIFTEYHSKSWQVRLQFKFAPTRKKKSEWTIKCWSTNMSVGLIKVSRISWYWKYRCTALSLSFINQSFLNPA